MIPDRRFRDQDKGFWAYVRTLSEEIGYTDRQKDEIKVPTLEEMRRAFLALGLNAASISTDSLEPTVRARALLEYFAYRAEALRAVKCDLLDADAARLLFEQTKAKCKHVCHLPLNKQTGAKKTHAYLTCIVTMILEGNTGAPRATEVASRHHGRRVGCPNRLAHSSRSGSPAGQQEICQKAWSRAAISGARNAGLVAAIPSCTIRVTFRHSCHIVTMTQERSQQ